MAKGDYVALADEDVPDPVELFHPIYIHKKKSVSDFDARPLLVPVLRNGRLVYPLPGIDEIRAYHMEQLKRFWPEYRRRLNPEEYPVSLSSDLWELRERMIARNQAKLR